MELRVLMPDGRAGDEAGVLTSLFCSRYVVSRFPTRGTTSFAATTSRSGECGGVYCLTVLVFQHTAQTVLCSCVSETRRGTTGHSLPFRD